MERRCAVVSVRDENGVCKRRRDDGTEGGGKTEFRMLKRCQEKIGVGRDTD